MTLRTAGQDGLATFYGCTNYQWQHFLGRLTLSLLVIPTPRNGALYPSGSSDTDRDLYLVTVPEQYCTPKKITKRTSSFQVLYFNHRSFRKYIMPVILEGVVDDPEPDPHRAFPL